MKIKILILSALLLVSCSNRYDGVKALLNSERYVIDKEGVVEFEVHLKADRHVDMSLHSSLSETLFFGVSNNECKKQEFDENNRSSETKRVSLSESESHILNFTAIVKDKGAKGYELDFGEMGTICIPKNTSEQIAFAVVPSDYDPIYRGESPIYSRHAYLVTK